MLDGRPSGREWLARRKLDDAYYRQSEDSLAPVTPGEMDPRSLRRRVLATVNAPDVARALRMESYFDLALSPCTNVRELLSGPDADVRAGLTGARKALARFPSEQALLDLMDRAPSSTMPPNIRSALATSPLSAGAIGVARFAGWFLRNPRIPGCVSILAGHGLL